MENSLIRTSLKSIKGTQQAEVAQLFHAFALVPEDTSPPLEVMGLLFASLGVANGAGSKLRRIPARLLVRKWLKSLIDRSLVLGTVDKPQVHDIVLEFVRGQLPPAASVAAHRCFIERLRAARPPGGWLNTLGFHDLSAGYVTHEIAYHMEHAIQKEVIEDKVAISWLVDHTAGRFDLIGRTAAMTISMADIKFLLQQAAESGDFWRCALLSFQAGMNLHDQESGMAASMVYMNSAVDYIQKVAVPKEDNDFQDSKDMLEMKAINRILRQWGTDDHTALLERLPVLMNSRAAKSDVTSVYEMQISVQTAPFFSTSRLVEVRAGMKNLCIDQMRRTEETTDPAQKRLSRLYEVGFTAVFFDELLLHHRDDMLAYLGHRGESVELRMELYNFSTDSEHLIEVAGVDFFMMPVSLTRAMLFLFGEVDRIEAMVNSQIDVYTQALVMQHAGAGNFMLSTWHGTFQHVEVLLMFGQRERAFALLKAAYPTVDTIDEICLNQMDEMGPATNRKKGQLCGLVDSANPCWHLRVLWILCSPASDLADPALVEKLLFDQPEPAELMALCVTPDTKHPHLYFCEMTLLCWSAIAMEKLGMFEKALEFARCALHTEVITGGNNVRWNHCLALGAKGRVLMRLGRQKEAFSAFEESADVAAKATYWFLEAASIRDWLKALPAEDHAGRAELETRRARAIKRLGTNDEATIKAEEFIRNSFLIL